MAGAMRKMAVYLGLVENEDQYDQYDEYDVVDRPEQYERGYDERTRSLRAVRDDEPVTRPTGSPSAPAAPRPAASVAGASRITTLHPRSYNDARAIGEQFREGTPVIMNLSEMDDGDAKRIVDFAAGLTFGLHGTIERVTQKVFLLSPANVVVTAEERERITQGGFFNQS